MNCVTFPGICVAPENIFLGNISRGYRFIRFNCIFWILLLCHSTWIIIDTMQIKAYNDCYFPFLLVDIAILGSLRARFDLSQGPSTPSRIAVQFTCNGATISKLNFELRSQEYKLSLVKKRFTTGEAWLIVLFLMFYDQKLR